MRAGVFAHRAAPVTGQITWGMGDGGRQYTDIGWPIRLPSKGEGALRDARRDRPADTCDMPNRRSAGDCVQPTREQAGLRRRDGVGIRCVQDHPRGAGMFDNLDAVLQRYPECDVLRAVDQTTRSNLQREAAARGVDAQRLVFAPHVRVSPEHLRVFPPSWGPLSDTVPITRIKL